MMAVKRELAARLAEVSSADRHWLLGQLSTDERMRLSDVLTGAVDERPALQAVPAVSPAQSESAAGLTAVEIVKRASGWQIAQALAGEPDWLVALLLARNMWPWARDYVDSMEPERVAALRTIARAVDASATAKTSDALVGVLAAKLERIAPELVSRNAFDQAVARLMGLRRPGD